MVKKLLTTAALLVAGGCRMCGNSCDYSSPVDGGAPLGPTRAASNLSGGAHAMDLAPLPTPVETAPQFSPMPAEAY